MKPNMPYNKTEAKIWFEQNYLDGDKIQEGQMLSSSECFDALTSFAEKIWEGVVEEVKGTKAEDYLQYEPATEGRRGFVDGFNCAKETLLAQLLNEQIQTQKTPPKTKERM